MAVKDGLPSTDFSRMNREYIKAVVEEAGGGSGGGGGGSLYVINFNTTTNALDKTFAEIYAAFLAGNILVIKTTHEATEEDGGADSYALITMVTRVYDLQGEGAGGFLVDITGANYNAATDADYPRITL